MEQATSPLRMDDVRLFETAQEGADERADEPADAPADEPSGGRGPVPFGENGAAFLRNLLQHAVFLGFVMVILMLMHILSNR